MKVAVLYICTGRYNQFFKGFYESSEKYFLKGIASVEYFVFTDNMELSKNKNVHLFFRKCQGFPMDSLFRFDMFISIKEQLKGFDYLFFFNANLMFVDFVGREFLPEREGIMAVVHPGFYRRPSVFYPYERNKKSTAYIPRDNREYHYYMGSLNGGKFEDYFKLIETCSKNTHKDYNQGIIAMVHDESHLNHYMHFNKCMGLPPAYAYPEDWKLPFAPKLILRDKVKLDSYFNKGRKHSLWGKIQKGFKILYNGLKWYF